MPRRTTRAMSSEETITDTSEGRTAAAAGGRSAETGQETPALTLQPLWETYRELVVGLAEYESQRAVLMQDAAARLAAEQAAAAEETPAKGGRRVTRAVSPRVAALNQQAAEAAARARTLLAHVEELQKEPETPSAREPRAREVVEDPPEVWE